MAKYSKKKLEALSWNVVHFNINDRQVEEYDCFTHYSFFTDLVKLLKKIETKEEFNERLNRVAMYYFWSKCEHEIVVGGFTSSEDHKRKMDVYDQLKMNWSIFIDYIWSVVK